MRLLCLNLAFALASWASDAPPVVGSWIVNPAAATASAGLRNVLPDVHAVRTDQRFVYVESAGISLQPLGALEAGGWEPVLGPRKFLFRFPLAPRRAEATSQQTPLGPIGAFLNGVPLFTPISPVSWRDRNLWHLDAVAANLHAGQGSSPLLSSLLESADTHSPLIGFALDGFPIYGPYGWDAAGKARQFQSGYRLRAIKTRSVLPDGTELTPAQEGPPVSTQYPLGSFVEDYEYVAGTGDLDEHNGRFAKTPEFPDGTYAYFLSTDAKALAFPYLVGMTFYGDFLAKPETAQTGRTEFTASEPPVAGRPVTLTFSVGDSKGRKTRFLEKVHEQPIHLAIVSTDLAEFAHVHPVLQPDDTFALNHTFDHGGTYWLYADYTPPGGTQTIARFRLDVKGERRAVEALSPENQSAVTREQDGLRATLSMPAVMRAGQDLNFRLDLPVTDLEPYLGAWAHIMILSADREEFIHAHPLDDAATFVDTNPWQHSHAAPGPSPTTITTITGFRKPGVYRLWVQFQRQGKVITIPYTIRILPAKTATCAKPAIPSDAIAVNVSTAGFTPARISARAGIVTRLAFTRDDARSCANSVLFPELGIRRNLPVGKTVLVEIPASAAGTDLHFACGMNMYRGELLITQ